MIGDSAAPIAVSVASTPSEIHEARKFQASRYLDAGYISARPPGGVIEDEWVVASTYHVARDVAGDVVGVCRFVGPSELGLPMLRHFNLDSSWSRVIGAAAATTYEMGALAADPNQPKFAVAAALYRQAVRQFRVCPGQVHLLAALDARLFRAMRRFMHFPFEQVGDPKFFLGSETVPAYLYLPAALERQVAMAPRAARFFSGFEAIDLVEEEIIDLRATYPELRPSAEVINLSDRAETSDKQIRKTF